MSEEKIVQFDEKWYLAKYPDVAEAVADGRYVSGLSHYLEIGQQKGRLCREPDEMPRVSTEHWRFSYESVRSIFDPGFYFSSYPLVRAEACVDSSDALFDHFWSRGRQRGYLPHRSARRCNNPATWHSAFGGFWTDQANALDLLEAKIDLGLIKPWLSAPIKSFVLDGYAIIEKAIPESVCSHALSEMERIYNGHVEEAFFGITGVSAKTKWAAEALTNPAKAFDIHWLSNSIRDLIFAESVVDFIHAVAERRALATQTLGFWRGSAQMAHQDSAYVNYSTPSNFSQAGSHLKTSPAIVESWSTTQEVTSCPSIST